MCFLFFSAGVAKDWTVFKKIEDPEIKVRNQSKLAIVHYTFKVRNQSKLALVLYSLKDFTLKY